MMHIKSSRHQGIKASSRLRLRLASSHRFPIVARAFTLIELMVVVAIILLLAALTVTVTTALSAGSDIRETENVIRLLDSAYDEWATSSKRQITFGPNVAGPPGTPVYDIDELDFPLTGAPRDEETQDELLSEILKVISRNAQAMAILQRIDSDFLKRIQHPGEPEHLHLFDAWDNEIRVVFPGRLDTLVPPQNSDGTVRTAWEERYGICQNRRIVFVSAGPDGEFGHLHLSEAETALSAQDRKDIALAGDNIYSYPIGKERPPS